MPRLEIYVLEHCRGCERARRNARDVQSRFPGVQVEVIDLARIDQPPPAVFSVPTYVFDGRVISLGNPRMDTLINLLAAHGGGQHGDDGGNTEITKA